MKFFSDWQEYISNKIYTTTSSTATMPPTTSTSKMPEIKDKMKEIKEELKKELKKELKDEMKERNEEMRKERKEELEKNQQDTIKEIISFCSINVIRGTIPKLFGDVCKQMKDWNWEVPN